MKSRRQRLEHLLELQRQIKGLHEMRHAAFLAQAAAAEKEAEELLAAAQADDSFADLFPEIYARRIAAAYERRSRNAEQAKEEAQNVSRETARTNIVERAHGEAKRRDERQKLEKEILEAVERLLGTFPG